MTPPTPTQDAADRALLWTPIQPPLTIADTQWGRWLVWRADGRRLATIHADYRATLTARRERRQQA